MKGSSFREDSLELITTNFNCRMLAGEKIWHFFLTRELLLAEEPAREKGRPFPLGDLAARPEGFEADIVARERVRLKGRVEGKAVFYGVGGSRELSWSDEEFEKEENFPGAFPGMELKGHARIFYIGEDDLPLEAEGKILYRLKIGVEVFLTLIDHQQLEVAAGVKGLAPERVTRGLLEAEELVAEENILLTLSSDFEVAQSPLYVKALNGYIKDFSWEQGQEGLSFKGELITAAYLLTGREGQFKEKRHPFSRQVSFPALKKGCQARFFPRVVSVINEALPGKIQQRTEVDIFIRITRPLQQEMVADIHGAAVRKEHLELLRPLGLARESLEVVEKLFFPYPRQITPGFSYLSHLEVEPRDGRIFVTGTMEKNVYYLPSPGELYQLEEEEDVEEKLPLIYKSAADFHSTLYLPGVEMNAETAASITFTSCDFAPGERETLQKSCALLEVKAWVREEVAVVVPSRVEPGTSFVVYAVKPGDTLLKVARRFGLRVQALALANGLEAEASLPVGQKLLIPLLFSREI